MQQHLTVKPLPFFYVGQKTTAERITRYQKNKHSLLTQAAGRPDTRSVWYSKEHFAKLLDEIEYAGGDGIRVYFGTYEDGHQFAGQTCLLFVTTREKQIGNSITHANVILEKEANYADRSSMEREVILFPGDDPMEDIRDFNMGIPCPPRCDEEYSG
ncbi:hypothetical protein [Chitinophaga rhizophila]|uniref:Uncharacterized protein n=1 Tax=Chitinophaga rhizophila TaxID=2866212 RepID=A0ABS7G9L2_9BACT|nr:hypothetical protein [Chitinophaga rhizophila]MBW8684353.1 hypothetical protein [Chitinophaga rhizophila]